MMPTPPVEGSTENAPPDPACLARASRLANSYQILVRAEDGAYVGRVPEIPTATGRGLTPDASIRATRAALTEHIAQRLAAGQPVSPPELSVFTSVAAGFKYGVARWAIRAAAAACVICAFAMIVVAVTGARSVLMSGPVVAGFGALVIALGVRARFRAAAWLGASQLAICVVFIAMVNLMSLSPDAAYAPFLVVGTPYVIALAVGTLWVARRAPQREQPWTCDGCGYLLIGLAEHRCPECGRAFDPERWAGIPTPT